MVTRGPVAIGKVQDKVSFSKIGAPRSMRLPIKLAGKRGLEVPKEYLSFEGGIKKIADFEYSANPGCNDYYAYLTVDQRFVPGGKSQRIVGAHIDGIPRNRTFPESQKIDHAFLVTDSIPTKFFSQKYNMTEFDLNKHDFFAIFRSKSGENNSVFSSLYDINLQDAYTVHSAIDSKKDVIRTFVRVEFSALQCDREGNSINPYLEYN